METTLFQTQEYKQAARVAMDAFRKKYPSTTSADMQTFIIGYGIGYGAGHIQGNIDQMNANIELKASNQLFDQWIMNASTDEIIDWMDKSKTINP